MTTRSLHKMGEQMIKMTFRKGLLGVFLGASLVLGQTATMAAGPTAVQLIESNQLPAGYHMLTPRDAKVLIDAGGVQILDVRTPEEFAAGHVAGAINIPYDQLRSGVIEGAPDVNKPLLIYCRTGRRANAVGPMLAETYKYVYNFVGVTQWPYELVQ